MRSYRPLTSIAVLAALVALSSCGSDDADPPAGSSDPTTSTSTGASDDETDASSGGLVDICTAITVADVAAITGAPVTVEDVPGGGCNFEQEDPRAPSVSFFSSAYDEGNGGFDGAVAGVTGVLQDSVGGEVSGIGDRAFVATGQNPGGSAHQGAGLVLVGGTLTQVGVQQGNDLSQAKVKAMIEDAVKLVASKG